MTATTSTNVLDLMTGDRIRVGATTYELTTTPAPVSATEQDLIAFHACWIDPDTGRRTAQTRELYTNRGAVYSKVDPRKTARLAIAEAQLAAYKLVAYAEDREIASSHSAIYKATRAALIVALTGLAGNRSRAWTLYSLWLDNGESIAYQLEIAEEAKWRKSNLGWATEWLSA